MRTDLFKAARHCLEEKSVNGKIRLSLDTVSSCRPGFQLVRGRKEKQLNIGRPTRPKLVTPGALTRRGFASREARLSLVHAIAHIEFNAINLAWDAIYRFRDMPDEYYRDWLQVAAEETGHFSLLRSYLNSQSCDYGDYDAHDGLWEMAEITCDDVLHRMAIVPRVLEARGLDVTPAMITKFRNIKEDDLVDIFEVIYREEIGHVKIGNNWFRYLCRVRGLDANETFIGLVKQYGLDNFKSGINRAARTLAGFSEEELDFMQTALAN